MCANELGSGLFLDEQFDIAVDVSTGDLQISKESEELRKDLAFNVALVLQGAVGGVPTEGVLRDIEILVERVVLEDVRIDVVDSVEASYIQRQQEVEIDVEATTVEGVSFEQVFTEEV